MDPIKNPFAPGAGTQPPELAGRGEILEGTEIALRRAKAGRAARSQLLLGLRGVGKTVLLNRIAETGGELGFVVIAQEAPEGRRLAELLVPSLRSQLFRLSRVEGARELARRGLGVLRAFAGAFKVSVGDVEFGVAPETGSADSGDLERDLTELLVATTAAAGKAGSGLALIIDEMQYLQEADLAALIVAVHGIGQRALPFIVFGAGLPQLAALAGEAKSYSERLFDYPEVGPLEDEAARAAIRTPVEREGAVITADALDRVLEKTRGYPYFLQEWGSHAWNTAVGPEITAQDVERASVEAIHRLDKGFFRVRLDRLTPRERDYVRAMAELGPGPHRSGDIAQTFGVNVTSAAPLRNGLIKKGMLFSPQHGDTAFTVPMFDEFMRRAMPAWSPPTPTDGTSRRRGRSRG